MEFWDFDLENLKLPKQNWQVMWQASWFESDLWFGRPHDKRYNIYLFYRLCLHELNEQ